jgi:pimeloyl-ACP methyl ester carboxylesterase
LRRVVVTILLIGLALATAGAIRFGPALLFTSALALPGFDAWLARWSDVIAAEEITVPAPTAPLRADLYRPPRVRGTLLLVHGLSSAGRRHPELVRLARLFARYGYLVVVPQLDGLAAFRLSGAEIDEIKAALADLRRRGEAPAVAGFSFGAGPALVAAADEPGLAWVGSFGGYADLRNVIVYLTTGTHTFQGRRYTGRVEEYNRWKLAALLAPLVADDCDRALLARIAARKLANPGEDTGALAAQLGPGGRAAMSLVESRREDQTVALVDRLSPATRAQLDRLSPIAIVPRLRARLLLAHGVDDDSIPFTEALRLAEAAGPRARVVILESFHHTGPRSVWTSLPRRAGDVVALLGLVDEMLGARRLQEGQEALAPALPVGREIHRQ